MDLLNSLLSGGSEKAIEALTGAGFSSDQADRFLPAAAESITEAAGKAGDMDPGSILGAVDMGALAERTGIPTQLIETGLQSLLPMVMEKLGGGSAAGLLSAAKRFF